MWRVVLILQHKMLLFGVCFDKSSLCTVNLTLHPKINICQGDEVLVNSYIVQDIFQDNVNCLKKMFYKKHT